ncbi:hypothetical protein M8494_28735 [Serratia ureilytica]
MAVNFTTRKASVTQGQRRPEGRLATGQVPRPAERAARSRSAAARPGRVRVAITLPHRGSASYDIGLDADHKEVSGHPPARWTAGEVLPVGVGSKAVLTASC